MNHNVSGLFQNIAGIRGDLYTPRRVIGANDFTQIAANFRGVRIDCAADFDGLLFTHQARDGCTNRADTILNGANLLLHRFLRFDSQQATHTPFLAAKETLTIKEFPNVGNAKRSVCHPMVQCGRPGGEEIMRWLFAVVLPFLVPMADAAAQEVTALVLDTGLSPGASSPRPRPDSVAEEVRDYAGRGTWEAGFGYALVGFRSQLFNSTLSGFDTTVSYYFRDHLAVVGRV